MIYIFELQNIIKNVHSIKEFKILFDILTPKERIDDISIHKELNKLKFEIENFDLKSIQLFNGGIVYKLTNQEWLFFKQKYNKIFEGYTCYKNVEYSFAINIVNLIEAIKKQIPDLSLRELNEIKNLASFGNTVSQISNKLNINIEKIRLVNAIYQSEIYQNFKENFINLVINNADENKIRETLNISKKRFKYYIDSYAREIHYRAFSKKNSILEDYYPNGTIKMRCPFKEGLINGKVSIYDSNGKLFKEIDFINGQIDGSIKVYDRKNNNYSIKKIKSNTQSNTITKIENNNITEKDLYENALKLNWRVLEFVPDTYKTEENCLIAFNQNELALQYFPSKYRTEEICRQAVEQNLLTFKDLPNKFKTKELSEKFFKQYSKELKHIPNTYRTKEICIKAFETNKNNFRYIPNEHKSIDMCKKAIEYSGDMLALVPKDCLNEELCLLAVKKDGLSIKYVPNNFKSQNVIIEAVKQNYRAISLITLDNLDDIAIFIKNNNEIFKHLPQNVKNKNLCEIALYQDIGNIRYIPPALIDENMCMYFLKKVNRTKIVGKKHLIKTIENRLKLLQLEIAEQKSVKTQVLRSTNYKLNLSKIETYDEIINSRKYKDQEDLIKTENTHDKVYNLTLIKNNFEKFYSDYAGKLSKINKNSSYIRIKTKFKNIYYFWKFRNNVLEISLEFSSDNLELTKYFNSIEKILRQSFNETLIVGQTKTKTVIYISTAKYSLDWAINTMRSFISIIDSKLEIFYDNAQDENITYVDSDNTEDNVNNDDIIDEQEYIHLNIIDGRTSTVKLTIYERNPKNRAEAIKIHGTTCFACGFNFNDFYGEDLAKDFIEIHHIKPVSDGEYTVNPKTDLVPLCSNCHSMIHKEKNPPKTIEEIKNRYKRF